VICRTKLVPLIVSVVILSASAFAQDPAPNSARLSARGGVGGGEAAGKSPAAQGNQTSAARQGRGGWVITAYVGGARTADSALRISQPALGNELTFERVRFRSGSFDPPLYYGFRAGYFLPRASFLGVESEFIHLKVFSNPEQRVRVTGLRRGIPIGREQPLGEIVQQYSISHGVNLLLFNVAARRGLRRDADSPRGRLILTGRAGVGPTLPHTESSVEGRPQEQYELGRLAWQAAGGAEFRLWRGVYALGEYKFTRTRQRGEIFSGRAESLLRTHHGVFGLSYHF
jgi:opacity protein-like surface antigen